MFGVQGPTWGTCVSHVLKIMSFSTSQLIMSNLLILLHLACSAPEIGGRRPTWGRSLMGEMYLQLWSPLATLPVFIMKTHAHTSHSVSPPYWKKEPYSTDLAVLGYASSPQSRLSSMGEFLFYLFLKKKMFRKIIMISVLDILILTFPRIFQIEY